MKKTGHGIGKPLELAGIDNPGLRLALENYRHNYKKGKIIGEQKAQEAPLTEYLYNPNVTPSWAGRFRGNPWSQYTLQRFNQVLDKLMK